MTHTTVTPATQLDRIERKIDEQRQALKAGLVLLAHKVNTLAHAIEALTNTVEALAEINGEIADLDEVIGPGSEFAGGDTTAAIDQEVS